jgi:hypothetical protein
MKLEIPTELRGKELTSYLEDTMTEFTDSIVQDPVEIDRFIRLWSDNLGLHDYSWGNCVLAWIQYPQVSMLAGFKKWKSLGRNVLRGERAIKILAPLIRKIRDTETDDEIYVVTGFKYVNVFDVNQTDGKNLSFGHEKMVKGNISFNEIRKISPLPVIVKYDGTSNGNITPERILIAPKDNRSAMVACLCHEIAHYKLNHLDSDLDKETKEVEAETVSYIVTSYLGLENEKAQYYVGAWNGTGNKLKGRGRKIISVAEAIIRDIEKL